jgi:uncharacterized membrane protein
MWFLPTLIVFGSLVAAVLVIDLQSWVTEELAQQWPRLLGVSADGSRAMLSAIATSMMTVAGVVFSTTMVALALASSQFSPRILRNFMRDRVTQVVLGVFVGVFAYCLVLLRVVRGGEDGSFIPSLGVVGGMLYVLVAIGLLIFFIHHVADSIQASSILAYIASDTQQAIDVLFPKNLGHPAPQVPGEQTAMPEHWVPVVAKRSGYVIGTDGDEVLKFSCQRNRVVRLPQNGQFVVEGTPVLELSSTATISKKDQKKLLSCVSLGRQRTVEQDAAFGFQQLVDMAVKALSPGINDPTTACMCIDYLGALLTRLASRDIPDPHRVRDGALRVIAPAPDFGDLTALAFNAIVRNSRGSIEVLARVLDAISVVQRSTQKKSCHDPLAEVARSVYRELHRNEQSDESTALEGRAVRIEQSLSAAAGGLEVSPTPEVKGARTSQVHRAKIHDY